VGKPWHPYEQNFINHPKFLILSAGAICLWLEGKNYCDMHLTDGLIPREALRTFRFNNRARVEELRQLTEGYGGALWEEHAVGFKMHDYLNHNPCREEVQRRMAAADASLEGEREATKARMKRWREARKRDASHERNSDRNGDRNTDRNESVTLRERDVLLQKQKQLQAVPSEQQKSGGGRKERPQFQNRRFAVHRWQVDELISMLGAQVEAFDLDEWLMTGAAARADEEVAIIPNWWEWLKAETLHEARRRGLPLATPSAPPARDYEAETRQQAEAAIALLRRDGTR